MSENEILRVHHIGGSDNPLGFANHDKTEVWCYDALESALTDPNKHVVNRAIADVDGEVDFYVTRDPSASSLLPVAQSAKDYAIIEGDPIPVWGIHAETVKVVRVKVNKLDTLVEQGIVPPIDFLSIDAQGAELKILNGASNQLKTNIVGVFLEVEYQRLYENQPLFEDTKARLEKDGFRLVRELNIQYFSTPTDSNVKMVAEALYLHVPEGITPVRARKLSRISAILGC